MNSQSSGIGKILWRGSLVLAVGLFGTLVGMRWAEGRRPPRTDTNAALNRHLKELSSRIDTLQVRQALANQAQDDGVRAAVRDELAAQHGALASPPPAELEKDAGLSTPVISPEAAVVLEQVAGLVDRSSAGGQWGDAEKQQFRELTRDLSADEQSEAIRKLAVVINSGKLRVTTRGFPL